MQLALRSAEDWERFDAWLQAERREATHSPEPRRTDPFWIYPLDPVSKGYVDSVLRAVPGYEGDTVHTVFADSLLDFSPERDLGHLSELPVLIAHGDQNALHPIGEARSLFERYPGPKELFWIEGGGHTEWMDDDDRRYKALQAALGPDRRLAGRAVSPDDLLVGAWDVHVHAAPSLFPRWGDGWDLAEECRAAGMRGIVLKAHHGSTVEVAATVARHFDGLLVLGGVVLNQFVGGIHPLVVEQTMALGGRFVWMPTIHAAHHGAAMGRLGAFSFQGEPLSHTPATGLSVLGPSGHVSPEVRDILALLDGTNVVLGTGHLSPVEILALRRAIVDDGRRVRLLINHVLFTVPNLDTATLEALSGSDVYFELCDFSRSPMANATTPATGASYLSVLPNALWVMASDSGQRDNAHSPEALKRYCTALTREGVGEGVLERMLKTHPAELMA